MAYSLTREALLLDLYAAFLCAKRHKGSKLYVQRFERHLKENLTELRDSLWDRTYASNACLHRMERNIRFMDMQDGDSVYRSVNSFLGVLSHYKTYRVRRSMFLRSRFLRTATFNSDITIMNKPYNYKEV